MRPFQLLIAYEAIEFVERLPPEGPTVDSTTADSDPRFSEQPLRLL